MKSLLEKKSNHLNAEFAHRMLLLELSLDEKQVEQDQVQELLQLYRVIMAPDLRKEWSSTPGSRARATSTS